MTNCTSRFKSCNYSCSFCLIQLFLSLKLVYSGLCSLQAAHAEVPSDATAVVHSSQTKSFDPSKSPLMSHSRVKVYGEVLISYPGTHRGVQDCPVNLPSQSAYVESLTALVMLFTSHEKGS